MILKFQNVIYACSYLFDIRVPKWFFKEDLVEFNWIN